MMSSALGLNLSSPPPAAPLAAAAANENEEDEEENREQINAAIAFGRPVQPSEIAETVYFVARNPAVNGTILHANLGQIEN